MLKDYMHWLGRVKLKNLTGISDPYEEPKRAEIVVDSSNESPEKLVDQIFSKIVDDGLHFKSERKKIMKGIILAGERNSPFPSTKIITSN